MDYAETEEEQIWRKRERTTLRSQTPPSPSPSVANSQPHDGIFTRLKEMKASNEAGQLDSKAMNEVLDFMISMIDVNKIIGPLLDRVAVLEEMAARLEKIHPEDEIHPGSSIVDADAEEASEGEDRLLNRTLNAQARKYLSLVLIHVDGMDTI